MVAGEITVRKAGSGLLQQQPKCCSRSPWRCGRGGDVCNCTAWLIWAPLPSETSTECVYFFPSSSCSSASAHPACRLQGNGIIFLPVVVVPAMGKKVYFFVFVPISWWKAASVSALCLLLLAALYMPTMIFLFLFFMHMKTISFSLRERRAVITI